MLPQLKIFNDLVTAAARLAYPLVHAANSAAVSEPRIAYFDAVRPGIALTDCSPRVIRP
jgi:alanine racemase